MRAGPIPALLPALLLAAGCISIDEAPAPEPAPAGEPPCGNGVLDPDEACDPGDPATGPCSGDCQPDRCGDGVTDPEEACDPALAAPGSCTESCELSPCGDGLLDPDEACDEGPANGESSPGCTQRCTIPRCGDGEVSPRTGEQCDGSADCDATCRRTGCSVVAVAASDDLLFLVRNDGALFVSGDLVAAGLSELLGFGPTLAPVEVPGAPAFVQLVSRSKAGAGLTADGRLFTFGAAPYGQRGDGVVQELRPPAETFTEPLPSSRFRDVVATAHGVLALDLDGAVWGFGGDGSGELGPIDGARSSCTTADGPSPCRPTAAKLQLATHDPVRLFAGDLTAGFVVRDGRAWGFGSNVWMQLGGDRAEPCPDGRVTDQCLLPPTLLARNVRSVAGSTTALLLHTASGSLEGLGGWESLGTYGDSIRATSDRVTLALPAGVRIAAVAGAGMFFVARTTDGRVVGVGQNQVRRFAPARDEERFDPVLVPTPDGAPVVEVAAGRWNTVVRLADGRAFAWGSLASGRLGNGVTEQGAATVPVELRVCPQGG